MKKLILIILTLSLTFHAWADHDRTPIKVNHNKTKAMGGLAGDEYYQKMINYNGNMYQLKIEKVTTNHGPGISTYQQYITLSLYDIGKNEFTELYHSYEMSTSTPLSPVLDIVTVYPDVFFGYSDYLWFFGYQNGIAYQYRYNIESNKMDIIASPQSVPDLDFTNNYFRASCEMDSSIFIFTSQNNKTYYTNSKYNNVTNTIQFLTTTELDNSMFINSAESFQDDDGVMKIVYTTLNNNSGSAKLFNPVTGTTATFFTKDDLNDIKIARGSIQGDKENQAFDAGKPTANNPDRWSVWFVKDKSEKHKGENYNKRCPIGFVQFVYENETFTRLTTDECRVVLPSDDYYAKQPEDAYIDICYNYNPVDKSLAINGNESFQKQIILINSDKNNCTNLSSFNSDVYMIDPSSTVPVTDFADESLDGINVRNYWTLLGITDGAPPAPMNWNLWEATHTVDTEPSELELEYSTEGLITVEESSENSYSLSKNSDIEFKIIKELKYERSKQNEHALTNESVNKLTQSNTYTISHTIGLNETNQQNATYIYLIPTIKRYNYKMYPWWDVNSTHPILGIDNYMLKTTGNTIKLVAVPLSKGIHQISDPNDSKMKDWVYRGNANINNTMAYEANMHGLAPIQLSWEAFQGSVEQKLTSETINLKKESYTQDTTTNLSHGFEMKDVFKFPKDSSYAKSYTRSVEVESSIEKSITIKYNVGNPEVGFMCDNLVLNTYLFTPQENFNWWYYDSLPNNYHPWYIAYGISTVSKNKLALLFPASNQQLMINQKPSFAWTEGFGNASLFILSKPDLRPENIVRKVDVGRANDAYIADLEPGKYYWAVQALDPEGVMAWSESRPFEVINQDFFKNVQSESSYKSLPVNVYPNPANAETTHASFDLAEPGTVHLMLFNLQGQLIWETSKNYPTSGIFREEIPLDHLKNCGLLKIQTPKSSGIAKILKF